MAPKSKRGKARVAAAAEAKKLTASAQSSVASNASSVVKISDRTVTGSNASRKGANDIKYINFSLSCFGEVRVGVGVWVGGCGSWVGGCEWVCVCACVGTVGGRERAGGWVCAGGSVWTGGWVWVYVYVCACVRAWVEWVVGVCACVRVCVCCLYFSFVHQLAR